MARKQLGVAVGSLAAGEPPREKLLVLAMEATVPREEEGGRKEGRGGRRQGGGERRGEKGEKGGDEGEEEKVRRNTGWKSVRM